MTDRDHFIDALRGIAIIVMIMTHVTSFFTSDSIAMWIWNWSHFSVPIFIFCSAYLFFHKNLQKEVNGLSYFRKRFLRLVIPYYIFLFFFIPVLFFLKPNIVTINFILQSIFIIGGVDINWLVLLFIYFACILPFFVVLFQKQKILFWISFLIALFNSFLFLFYVPPISYKFIMWIPWSLMLYFTLIFLHYEKKNKKILIVFFVAVVVLISSYYLRVSAHQSTILIHNKYPPNIFYLSYGISCLMLLSFLFKRFQSKRLIANILRYFSSYSYPLYFIHYLILTVYAVFLPNHLFNWFTFFVAVLITTIAIERAIFYVVRVKYL
jgi:peptidoglycan/LPS O-acetylase OafA/YrhL